MRLIPLVAAGAAGLVAAACATAAPGRVAAPSPAREATEAPAPAPDEAAATRRDRRVVADSTVLVFRASERDRGARGPTDLDAERAAVIRQINRTRGTWQSYLLATREDLPIRLFHHGFTVTLPPPRTGPRPPAPPARAGAPASSP